GRPTVAALVAGAGRVYPVGRLDLKSTGLLLLTNDGALAAGLLHPRGAVTRVYHVKVDGTPSEEAITRLRRGVRLADGKTVPAHVRVLERLPTKTWLQATGGEGLGARPPRRERAREGRVHPPGDRDHNRGRERDAGGSRRLPEAPDAPAEHDEEEPEVAERDRGGGEREPHVPEAEPPHEEPV